MSRSNRPGHLKAMSFDSKHLSPRQIELLKSYTEAKRRDTLMVYASAGSSLSRKGSISKTSPKPSRVAEHIQKYNSPKHGRSDSTDQRLSKT